MYKPYSPEWHRYRYLKEAIDKYLDDYVDNQVKRLVSLITSDAFGTINVGRETVSMYELAKETKEDVRRDECDYPVPEILTMNIDKMKEMI